MLLVAKSAFDFVVAAGSSLSSEATASSRRSPVLRIAQQICGYRVGNSRQRFSLRLQARLNLLLVRYHQCLIPHNILQISTTAHYSAPILSLGLHVQGAVQLM